MTRSQPDRRKGGNDSPVDLAVLLLVLGDYWRVERALACTLDSLQRCEQPVECVIIYDGPGWSTCPLLQQVRHRFPGAVELTTNCVCDIPGRLANLGLARATAEYCTVVWPGCSFDWQSIAAAKNALKRSEQTVLAYTRAKGSMARFPQTAVPLIHHGHLQSADLISLDGAVIRTRALRDVGGFDPNPLFQRYLGWEVALRLSEHNPIEYVPTAGVGKDAAADSPRRRAADWSDWHDYPFVRTLPFSLDEIHRAVVRPDRLSGGAPSMPPCAERLRASRTADGDSIRITVVGGVWEPAHNQLCFNNYFGSAAGLQRFSWKSIFDLAVDDRSLTGSDLIIISRGRHAGVRSVLDFCERTGTPSLYMIDDNWFTVASDWPVYKSVLAPGSPDYEVFIESLRRTTAVLVYNDRMHRYVAPYARRVVQLDINIALADFPRRAGRPEKAPFTVGYAGTPRYTSGAFAGLAQFLDAHHEARGLVFGTSIPPELESLARAGRLLKLPYTSYKLYARQLCEIAPDVLLAPLEPNETTRSKCYNKFLEIAACGAAGIYSGLEPYSLIVVDGVTGLMIPPGENDNSDSWRRAIERLDRDRTLLAGIRGNARRLVEDRFETNQRFEDFYALLHGLVEESRTGTQIPDSSASGTAHSAPLTSAPSPSTSGSRGRAASAA